MPHRRSSQATSITQISMTSQWRHKLLLHVH